MAAQSTCACTGSIGAAAAKPSAQPVGKPARVRKPRATQQAAH